MAATSASNSSGVSCDPGFLAPVGWEFWSNQPDLHAIIIAAEEGGVDQVQDARAFDTELPAGIVQALISAVRRDRRSDQIGLCVVKNKYSRQRSINIAAAITL